MIWRCSCLDRSSRLTLFRNLWWYHPNFGRYVDWLFTLVWRGERHGDSPWGIGSDKGKVFYDSEYCSKIIREVNICHLAEVFDEDDGSRSSWRPLLPINYLGMCCPLDQKTGWINMSSHWRFRSWRVWTSPWPLQLGLSICETGWVHDKYHRSSWSIRSCYARVLQLHASLYLGEAPIDCPKTYRVSCNGHGGGDIETARRK